MSMNCCPGENTSSTCSKILHHHKLKDIIMPKSSKHLIKENVIPLRTNTHLFQHQKMFCDCRVRSSGDTKLTNALCNKTPRWRLATLSDEDS